MIQAYYDLHIHSALSPCADDDMVPGDIVGMAILNNLDVIAVTDHNCFANAKAVIDAAKNAQEIHGRDRELIVLPGAEISTAEEVHVICLFDVIDTALAFEKELTPFLSQMKNRADVFGEQTIYASSDKKTGTIDRMLIAPTSISFDSLFALTQKHGGAFVPAHVDRTSFSVTSNLGFLPPDLDIAAVEFTSRSISGESNEHDFSQFPGKKYVFSSDAHQLFAINERNHHITVPEFSSKAIINYLRF